MSGVRVIIDTTEEGCCSILANELEDEMGTTWMLFNERADIVDKTRDKDEWPFRSLIQD